MRWTGGVWELLGLFTHSLSLEGPPDHSLSFGNPPHTPGPHIGPKGVKKTSKAHWLNLSLGRKARETEMGSAARAPCGWARVCGGFF